MQPHSQTHWYKYLTDNIHNLRHNSTMNNVFINLLIISIHLALDGAKAVIFFIYQKSYGSSRQNIQIKLTGV